MEQIGWFVVGEGNFGPYFFSKENYPLFFAIESSPSEIEYWKNRGYEIIPAYMDLHNYIFEGVEFSKFRLAEEVEFRSGDNIHRFPISKDNWVNVSFDEETNKLLVTTEKKFGFNKDE